MRGGEGYALVITGEVIALEMGPNNNKAQKFNAQIRESKPGKSAKCQMSSDP
jgi:hypothetical protein